MESIDLTEYKFSYKVQPRWSDMDELHHVNNAVYLSYLEDARGRYLHHAAAWDWMKDGIILANVNINYVKSIHFLNEIYVYVKCSKLGNKSFDLDYLIVGFDKEGNLIIYSTAKTTQVMFDYQTNSSVIIPTHLKEKITAFDQGGHKIQAT